MVEIKWIKISLFLMVVLQYTAAVPPFLFVTVRVGDEVTLPCENVIDTQQNCNGTHWLFSGNRVPLFKYGQIHRYAGTKSDRLSLTANCSLVINKFTVEDVGRYSCRQFNIFGQQQGPDSLVYLYVITTAVPSFLFVTARVGDEVTLPCENVIDRQQNCDSTLWFFSRSRVMLLEYGRIYRYIKSDRLTLTANCFLVIKKVTVENAGHYSCRQFNSSGYQQGPGSAFALSVITKPWMRTLIIRSIIVSVGLAAVIITVVAVNIWTKTKGKKTQTDENMLDNDEDDGTVNYENTRSSDV